MSVFFSSSPSRRWWRVGAVCLGLTPLAQANDAVLQEVSVTVPRAASTRKALPTVALRVGPPQKSGSILDPKSDQS